VDCSVATQGLAIRSYGKKNNPLYKKELQRLKQLKPQKLLKLFCHTTTIESIFHGQDAIIEEVLWDWLL